MTLIRGFQLLSELETISRVRLAEGDCLNLDESLKSDYMDTSFWAFESVFYIISCFQPVEQPADRQIRL
jgi:hypothetical protein